jgi:hypothetical protein
MKIPIVMRAWTSGAHGIGVIIHIIGQSRERRRARSEPLRQCVGDAVGWRMKERLAIHTKGPARLLWRRGEYGQSRRKAPFLLNDLEGRHIIMFVSNKANGTCNTFL